MTGHNRIPTKAPLISERRAIALAEAMILGILACLFLFAVIA
ncbi:hypothetical protein [Herminiimonas contaminans]|nr:hypothetical protein [Herminiimonas contaminans]